MDDKDEWIDSELDLEDEIRDDDIDCGDEEPGSDDDTLLEEGSDDERNEDDERLMWELLEDSSHEHSVLTRFITEFLSWQKKRNKIPRDLVQGPEQERELSCIVLSTEYTKFTEQS